MYGDIGNKLVQHAKKNSKLEHLPPYQTEMVRAVTREVRDLDKDASSILQSSKPEEEEYVRQYSDLLAAFKGHWTDIDLTGSLEPPRICSSMFGFLKDAGEIQTEYGTINLTKNSQFYVRQGDVDA
ncbi:hypothetical protein DID88_001181 [Monilinia fructigena]|uniref:DNA replication complex GINS protein PSF1 n=1 Tax=Monilinia fructigena TaxID=38457 RepID=A0A395IYX8_9HELO|nr:hypothetical protein DID88_001181 [Monilinia fructigena]